MARQAAAEAPGNSEIPERDPGLRNEELLVEVDGETVGHPCQEIARRRIQSLCFDRPSVEIFIGPLPQLLPQAAENPCRLGEFGRSNLVFVYRVEKKAA